MFEVVRSLLGQPDLGVDAAGIDFSVSNRTTLDGMLEAFRSFFFLPAQQVDHG
jgi:hypothetical protein